MASFAFDVYFGLDAFELRQNFSFFGDDNNVNAPAFIIFLAISSNIASLIALYYGSRNNWFYAAADNDSWD